jgi:hypothetical protein
VVACGDARDKAFLADLVGEAKASAAILDLPYNLPIDGVVSGKGKKTHREFAMASGEMTPSQFTPEFYEAGCHSVFMGLSRGHEVIAMLQLAVGGPQ